MTLQELITDLKAAGANENTMQLAMNCYELGLANAQRKMLTVDCIGLALELEAQAKRVESQTVERAMLAAANGLRNIEAAHGIKGSA